MYMYSVLNNMDWVCMYVNICSSSVHVQMYMYMYVPAHMNIAYKAYICMVCIEQLTYMHTTLWECEHTLNMTSTLVYSRRTHVQLLKFFLFLMYLDSLALGNETVTKIIGPV